MTGLLYQIYKTKNLLTLSVDGVAKFFVIKQVKATETNTKDPLYLGGIPPDYSNRGLETNGLIIIIFYFNDYVSKVPILITESFRGCIRGIIMGKKPRRKKDLDLKDVHVHGDVHYGPFCPVN